MRHRLLLLVVPFTLLACDALDPDGDGGRVDIDANGSTILVSSPLTLTAAVKDGPGNVLPDRSVTWTTTAPGVTVTSTGPRTASVSASCTAAPAVKEATIQAHSNGMRGSIILPVGNFLGAVIRGSSLMRVGRSTAVSIVLHEGSNGVLSPGPVAWSSSDASVVSLANGMATAHRVGSATLTATACGRSFAFSVTVRDKGFSVRPIASAFSARALNDSGYVAGVVNNGTAQAANVLWRDGVQVDLGDCVPVSLNNVGQVLCGAGFGAPGPRIRIWQSGSATTRDTLVQPVATARLNDSGYVAASTGYPTRVLLWRSPGRIDTLPGSCSVFAFNNGLHVAGGQIHTVDPYPDACRIRDGVAEHLTGIGRYAHGRAMNDSGDLVGTSEWIPARLQTVAMMWPRNGPRQGLAHVSPFLNDLARSATGINNRREIVGDGAAGAFYWRDGRLSLLSALVSDGEWTVTSAIAINSAGQILAMGTRSGGPATAVLLNPEP